MREYVSRKYQEISFHAGTIIITRVIFEPETFIT